MRARVVHLRRTVIPLPCGSETLPIALHGEVQIIGNKEIQPAVTVVIDPSRARTPARIVHARLFGYVGEGSVSVVVVEHVVSKIRDVQILEAVIVVVANGDSHSVSDVSYAGLLGDVNKLQLPSFTEQVAEEAISRFPSRRWGKFRLTWILRRIEGRTLNQVHIEVAVVIVIE